MAANPNVPQTAWDAAFLRYMDAEFSVQEEIEMSRNAHSEDDN